MKTLARVPRSLRAAFLSQQVQVRDCRYFFLRSPSSPRAGVQVICGGWERCAPHYEVNRKQLAFHGLEFVAEGRGSLTLHGRESRLVPGTVFAYGPTTAHQIRSSAEAPLGKYFIDFSGPRAGLIAGRKILGAGGVAYLHGSQPVRDLCEQMLAAGQKGGLLAGRVCALLLELLSLRIAEDARLPAQVHSRARQTFERCRVEMERDFRTLGSVADLASRTHLDRAYLSRLFHRFSGESPRGMLTRLKMNEAAAQLYSGMHTVKEVAGDVGFPDPYHFSRVFKRQYGVPPARLKDAGGWKTSGRS